MSPEEKGKGFNYEAHERLKRELEESEAKGLEDAETSDANEDAEFGDPVIDGELPPFWKPDIDGEKRIAEVTAVRKTKDFGKGRGEAIVLRGAEGRWSLPIGAGLVEVDWRRMVGRTFMFIFKGWIELKDDTRMRKFVVRPKKGDGVPF